VSLSEYYYGLPCVRRPDTHFHNKYTLSIYFDTIVGIETQIAANYLIRNLVMH
jgi:hypothetical protein